MSDPADLVLMSVSLSRLISILVAVWLASRFEPRLAALLHGEAASPPGAVPRTLIWLGLGSIFAITLFDLIGLLQMLVELVAPASWGLADGTVPTFWGSAPPRVYDALSAGTTLAVYPAACLLLWRPFREQPSPSLAHLAPSGADRILLSLACAGLINLIVTAIVVSVVFVQLPTTFRAPAAGAAGFVAAWLIGLLLVLALVLWMHLHVQQDDAEG
jgi:uncharacterized membrane protein required for colicin V production